MSLLSKVKQLPYFGEVQTLDDLDGAIKANETVENYVNDGIKKKYLTIDVSDATINLSNISKLLKISNAASYGLNCNISIKKVLGDFQTLVNDCFSSLSEFIFNSISFIGLYKMSIKMAENKKIKESFKIITNIGERIREMVDKLDKIVKFSETLINETNIALIQANDENDIQLNKLKEIENKKANLNTNAENLKKEMIILNDQIVEMKHLTEKMMYTDENRNSTNISKIISVITEPISMLTGPYISACSGAPSNGAIRNLNDMEENGDELLEKSDDDNITRLIKKKKKLDREYNEIETQLKNEEEKYKKYKELELTGITREEGEIKIRLGKKIEENRMELNELYSTNKSITRDIVESLNNNLIKYHSKEKEYKKLKTQYQSILKESNDEFAKTLYEIKDHFNDHNLNDQDYLKICNKSLELVIANIIKVKSIFENVLYFYLNVENNCKILNKVSENKDLSKEIQNDDDLIEFVNQLKKGGMNWLSIAYINQLAYKSITSVKKEVDQVMNNMPGKDDASTIVNECYDELIELLKIENSQIEEVIKKINIDNDDQNQSYNNSLPLSQ